MRNRLFVLSQYLAPQHTLSRAAGLLADCAVPAIKDPFIRWFIKRHSVDMSEAVDPRPEAYPTFNDFFTRAFKDNARPIDSAKNSFVAPVDGTLSQFGEIRENQIYQAKGHEFSLEALLGGRRDMAAPFIGGQFATIYLAPNDYHRIHMPIAGTVREMVFVPGRLFSVNPVTAENVPGLFARNERLVVWFDTEWGPMVLVLVGAMIVASIETVWSGVVAPRCKATTTTVYPGVEPPTLEKGAEMGRFRLGSTVVALLPKNTVNWRQGFEAGMRMEMGKAIGTRVQQ
ncbi:archaetidylserine decarboxylase [Hydrocarboniclastica marina]|uniref:Phosphatidylserine decarboxylase proenzyme n=1 Tax=Hydrocarboniclastica marina TaxID=2259620 RepID=A0A4P7XHU8_9ALTE|nr:archaetidylserine decarboxylase [Hydrocarboniclastica marina]QCF26629.1 phosphatidylserine decarboxylase [Hydrocarboniclastica marina]